MTPTKEDLAVLLAGMTYSDLREVGNELFGMTQSDDGKQLWDLGQEHQWADLLSAWAESSLPAETETPREEAINAE